MNATLQITEKCNFRCKYCFEGEKSEATIDLETGKLMVDFTYKQFYKEMNEKIRKMAPADNSEVIVKRAELTSVLEYRRDGLDKLVEIGFLIPCGEDYKLNNEYVRNFEAIDCKYLGLLQNYKQTPLYMLFYGGEALLDFDLCNELYSYIVNKAVDNNIWLAFEVITNGYVLDDRLLEILKNDPEFIIKISIDGIALTHDANRVTVSGEPTHAKVISNALRLLEVRKHMPVAMVITPQTAKYFYDSIIYLNELGFINFQLGFERFNSTWEQKDFEIFEEQFMRLGMWYADKKLNGVNINIDEFNTKLAGQITKTESIAKCGSGEYKYFINVKGDIYPCPVGNNLKPLHFGDIYKGFYGQEALDLFAYKNIKIENCDDTCQECVYCHECFLTCFANNLIETGNVKEVSAGYCELTRIMINCSTKIGNYMNSKDSEKFHKLFYPKIKMNC